MAFIKVSWKN